MSIGRQTIEIDIQAMEDLIADPSNTMDAVGMLLGVSAETIYARKNRDKGFNRAYERGQLRRDAACIHSNGFSKDVIVLTAISLGFGTRRELKEALGFGYDVIEKAIERNSGEIRYKTTGQIERFEFIGTIPNCDSSEAENVESKILTKETHQDTLQEVSNSIAEALPVSQHKNEPSGGIICEKCGPRSVGSVKHYNKCYRKSVALSEQDVIRAGQLRAEGKTMDQIAAVFEISASTLANHRNKNPALEAALVAGHEEYYRIAEQEDKIKPSPITEKVKFEATQIEMVESDMPEIQGEVITSEISDKDKQDISTLESAIEVLKKERAELDAMIHMLENRITLRYCVV